MYKNLKIYHQLCELIGEIIKSIFDPVTSQGKLKFEFSQNNFSW